MTQTKTVRTYGSRRSITNEARYNTTVDLEAIAGHETTQQAKAEGWEPISPPAYEWHQYSEAELMIDPPDMPLRAGDWELRCWLRVVKVGAA